MNRGMLLFISLMMGLACLAGILVIGRIYRASAPLYLGDRLGFTLIPAPTSTKTEEPTKPVSLTAVVPSTSSAMKSDIRLNSYVQVNGTQGDGLRLREKPGIGNTILSLASESEVFVVLEGPIQADGYQWWYIADPYNEKRRGWAAENYLIVVQ